MSRLKTSRIRTEIKKEEPARTYPSYKAKNDRILAMSKERHKDKEWKLSPKGETIIKTSRAKITIPPHLPYLPSIPTETSKEKLEEMISFCRRESKGYRLDTSPHHKKATSAIKRQQDAFMAVFF